MGLDIGFRAAHNTGSNFVQAYACCFLGYVMRSRQQLLSQLRSVLPVIAPSMLKCDFGNLHREFERLQTAGTEVLHLDVMDGHFVPNLSYGPMVIERMRQHSGAIFDAHLMISGPGRYLDEYVRVGCEAITIHLEAVPEPAGLLRAIRERGLLAGLAVNPGTGWSPAARFLDEMDLFLVMSVQPGFGGQKFIPGAISTIREARLAGGDRLLISVDGGIGKSTIAECAKAGCDLFVAGSSVFDEPCYSAAMAELRRLAMEARAAV